MSKLTQLLSTLLVFTSLHAHGKVLNIAVDPGHGGGDYGARHQGQRESHLNLQISKKLHQLLKEDKAFSSFLTRTTDQEISLEERVRQSQAHQADLFVSIHANASPNPKVKGTELFIENQLSSDEETLRHAHNELKAAPEGHSSGAVESILNDLNRSHRILKSYQLSSYLRNQWPQKGKKVIRQGPFYVLNHNHIPAVLVEVGYLTHAQEREELLQEKKQWEIARKIRSALRDYAKNMDKLPSGILQPGHATPR